MTPSTIKPNHLSRDRYSLQSFIIHPHQISHIQHQFHQLTFGDNSLPHRLRTKLIGDSVLPSISPATVASIGSSFCNRRAYGLDRLRSIAETSRHITDSATSMMPSSPTAAFSKSPHRLEVETKPPRPPSPSSTEPVHLEDDPPLSPVAALLSFNRSCMHRFSVPTKAAPTKLQFIRSDRI